MQIEAKLPKYFDLYTLYLFSFCNTIYFSVTCYYFLIFSSYSASDHLEHCVLNVTLVNIILFCLKTLSLSMLLICVFLCVWLVIWTGFQTKGKKKSCFLITVISCQLTLWLWSDCILDDSGDWILQVESQLMKERWVIGSQYLGWTKATANCWGKHS